MDVIFSGGSDNFLKAWIINREQGVLTSMETKQFEVPVISLKMMSETFLVVGLQNGSFQGWNLSLNSFDVLPAHPQSVTSMHKH